MDIDDFRIFVRLAATRNLSAVAAEFDLTPGTISKRLQAIEDELGARLFDRTTRAINITEEGSGFLKHAELILETVDQAFHDVTQSGGHPRGRLKISVATGLGARLAAPVVSGFMQTYPDVDVQVQLTDRVGSLLNEGFDVAIRNVIATDGREIARRLGPDPQIIVAAPAYLERRGMPVTPNDLTGHDCLFAGDGGVWSFVRDGQPITRRLESRIRSNSSAVIQQVALEGYGILRHAEMFVRKDVQAGRLVPLLTDFAITTQDSIYAVYPQGRHMPPRVRAFIDFLVDWFRRGDGWPARIAPSATHAGTHHDGLAASATRVGKQPAKLKRTQASKSARPIGGGGGGRRRGRLAMEPR